MKIETNNRDDQQVQMIVELDGDSYQSYMHRAGKKISRESKIPGFRPGKAPYDFIKRLYGEDFIQKQAIELMVDEIYPQALKQAELNPSGPGNLDEIISNDPPKFSFIVPLQPEVVLGDYHSIRKEYIPVVVAEEEVDQFLQNLRVNYATAEPADDRPVQDGDLVYIQIEGQLAQPAEGEDAQFIPQQPRQIIVGENNPDDSWPFEGFSKELVGLSLNQEITIAHAFPEDAPSPKLAGKEAAIQVTVKGIRSMQYPELNDDFAQTLGDFENLETVRTNIRSQITNERTREYDNQYFNDLINEIVSQSIVKYPPYLLDQETEHVIHTLEDDLGRRKMDLEAYLKTRQIDRDTFVSDEARPAAKQRLERSLVLEQVSKAEQITLEEQELKSAVSTAMDQLADTPGIEKINSKTKLQELANAVTYETANRLLNQHLLERLKLIATGQLENQPNVEETPQNEIEDIQKEADLTTEETNSVIEAAASQEDDIDQS